MGIAGTGDAVDEVGQQRARTGEQDVDGFHGMFPLQMGAPGPRTACISVKYSTSKASLP